MTQRPPRLPTSRRSDAAVLSPPSAESPQDAEPTGPISRDHLSLVQDDPAVSDGSAGRAWRADRAARRTERVRRLWDFFEGGNPYTNYWLVLGATIALSAMGLTMVLSSTSVTADGQAFTTATRQAVWAVVGVIGMIAMTLVPTRWMGTIGWVLMFLSSALLVLVAFSPLGHTAGGSTNWIRIGPVQGQPSELAKLALVLWGAAVLARKGKLIRHFTHWMMPFVAPGALSVLVLVLAGGDLGTAVIIILLVGAMLFAAGVSMLSLIHI